MKQRLLSVFVIVFICLSVQGQSVGINTATPDTSAALDVQSTTKGLLFPRMTSAQRVAIPNPSQGLVVFDTELQQLFLFDKTKWVTLNSIPAGTAVGDMLYWGGSRWTRLPAGTESQPLVFCNGVPQWGYCPGSFAAISTSGPSAVAPASVSAGGDISSNGGSSVSSRGLVYDTLLNPTILSGRVNAGSGAGVFSTTITGLIPNKQYYIRAFAINNAGAAYGSEITATTPLTTAGGGVTDVDGNVYTSVIIGSQEWTKQNLKTTHYTNGDLIPNPITTSDTWDSIGNLQVGAWCYYNNNYVLNNPYGKLYNWYAVIDTRNLCPIGWHVSTEGDWRILNDYLGGWRIAGGTLKETGISHWQSPNTGATNATGFTAVGGGERDGATGNSFGTEGDWITPTDGGGQWTTKFYMRSDGVSCNDFAAYKKSGFSVRCVKNQ